MRTREPSRVGSRNRGSFRCGSFVFTTFALAASAPILHAADGDSADAEKDRNTLATVTVTAEKTQRSLQDTATSVAVFTADQIEQQPGLESNRDLFANIANVTTGNGSLAPAVRGIDGTGAAVGGDAFFAGSRQRLGLQIDGRPASYNEVIYGSSALWDVEQVEMLRGSQSTLQGRNAIAGTMAIKTNDPTFQPEYGARVIFGNFDRQQVGFYASGPIGAGEQVAYRVTAEYETHESYVRGFQSYANVVDPGRFRNETLRGKLLFKPAALDDFTTVITFNHAENRGLQGEAVYNPYDRLQVIPPGVPALAHFAAWPVFEPQSTSVIADTKWGLGERFAFENLLSGTDLDIHRYALPGQGNAQIDAREWLWEPHLVVKKTADSLWSGLFGAYVYRANQSESIDFIGNERFSDHIATNAVFGQVSIDLPSRFELTLGARYERETHQRHGGDGAAVAISVDETSSVFLPKLDLAWHANEHLTFGVDAGRGYNGGGAGITFAAPIVNYVYGPEYVWNYEAYFRSDLLGGRLRLSGNVFHSDYKDMQLPFNIAINPGEYSDVVRNAPKATTDGAEIGARWLLRPGLEGYADVGLLDTKVTKYPNSGIQGNELARSPHATGNLGLQYRSEGGLELSASLRYSDGYYSSVQNVAQEQVHAFWLANAQAGYRFNERWRVFGYVTNLFDSTTPLFLNYNAPGLTQAYLATPRTFGVGAQMWF